MIYRCFLLILLSSWGVFSLDAAEPGRRLTNVDVLSLVAQPLRITASYLGTVTPFRRSRLSAQIEGQVEDVLVSIGQPVKKGQILAKIETSRLALSYKLVLSNYRLARGQHRREAQLFAKKLTSRVKLTELKNRMEVTYYQMKLAQQDLEHSKLKAPFASVVGDKRVEVGEYVKKGNQLFELMDLSKVKVRVQIPEREIGFAKKGKSVLVTVDALGSKSFEGKIDSVSLQANLQSRSFLVQVKLDNPKQQILSGMLARVEMETLNLTDQLVIPRDAVLEDEKGSYVYLELEGVIQKKQIRLGHSVGDRVQVEAGLNPGELLVVSGQQMVNQAEKVHVNKTTLQGVRRP